MTPPPHAGLIGAAADVTGLHILKERRRQSARPLGSAADAQMAGISGLGPWPLCIARALLSVERQSGESCRVVTR